MADYSVLTPAQETEVQVTRMLGQLRVMLPGYIKQFIPNTQRCVIKPGIRLKVTQGEEVTYLDLPELHEVPIMLPWAMGTGLYLTLPIKENDPCMVIFSDRSIEEFLKTSKESNPIGVTDQDITTPRMHHLSDGICIPGLITDQAQIPQYSTSAIEIRDLTRTVYFSLNTSGITMTDGKATWNMTNGRITINVPDGMITTSGAGWVVNSQQQIYMSTPSTVTITGSNVTIGGGSGGTENTIQGGIRSTQGTFTDKDGIVLGSHVHSGVQSGGSNTGGPVS